MIRLVSWWNEWFSRFLSWRVRHIKERNFLIVLSMLVGIITGLAGVLLKNSVHFTHLFFTEHLQIDSGSLLFFVYPFIGILLTSLFVRYCVPEDINHGVTKVLYAISRQNSMIRPHNSYSSMIASTVTIGFGGSVGTEATIVLTGASIGSNLARFFHMNYKVMTLMIGCGAAGAIAGIFKAPIAGIVFTLEVLMLDLTMTSLVPLMISAISSYVIVYFLMGDGVVLEFAVRSHFALANVPYYILLGMLCGLVSVYLFNEDDRGVVQRPLPDVSFIQDDLGDFTQLFGYDISYDYDRGIGTVGVYVFYSDYQTTVRPADQTFRVVKEWWNE